MSVLPDGRGLLRSLENAIDRWLGVPYAPQLNWKGRLIERGVRAQQLVAVAITFPFRLAANAAHRLERGLDRLLGLSLASSLEEKDNACEPAPFLRPRRVMPFRKVLPQLDRRLGLIHSSQLNWKGRMVERLLALRRRLTRRWMADTLLALAAGPLVNAANAAGYAFYSLLGRLRRRDRVRSVLQLSIISHKPFMISRVLRDQGLRSMYFALNVGPDGGILNVGWDYAMRPGIPPGRRRILECFYLWTVLARYDVIHTHFKSFLSESAWEFEYLKRLGKVVVCHFRGCDVRHRSLNMRLQPVLNCCQECEYPVGSCDTPYQASQVALARKYADLVFVTTPDLVDFAPGSEHIPFIHPVGIDFDAILPAARDRSVFRVVTSSNHHGIDGTKYIRAAIERLREEGERIELVEVNNMKYLEALSVYKSADVYVGKLRMGYYNNANIETMLLGVPNMSYIRAEFRAAIPDCPIIITTPDTVYERLRYYLSRREELAEIARRGPAFVRAHHDPGMLAQRMIARYNEAFAERRRPRGAPDLSASPSVGGKKVIPVVPTSPR